MEYMWRACHFQTEDIHEQKLRVPCKSNLSMKLNNRTVKRRGNLFQKYIYTYIYQSAIQTGYLDITKSYTVQQPHTGSNCVNNKCALINLSMGD